MVFRCLSLSGFYASLPRVLPVNIHRDCYLTHVCTVTSYYTHSFIFNAHALAQVVVLMVAERGSLSSAVVDTSLRSLPQTFKHLPSRSLLCFAWSEATRHNAVLDVVLSAGLDQAKIQPEAEKPGLLKR